jgi:hypothetical protein
MNGIQLRAPTFDEAVAIDNYKAASKEALAAANGVGDKIVAAAFSFATAYGAVIALVAPKESPALVVVVIPLLLLAAAAVLALWSQSIGVKIAPTDEVSNLRTAVNSAISAKRWWSRGALATLVVGVVIAGIVVNDNYAEPAKKDSPVAVQVFLTPAGARFADKACGGGVRDGFEGTVESASSLTAERVGVMVAASGCAAGASTLYLDQKLIAALRQPNVSTPGD